METRRVEVNGVELAVLTEGEGPRSALLLHGFPDDAGSMRGLMTRLAGMGYRCWSPYLRGYGPSGKPSDGVYTLRALAQDAVELARRMGEGQVTLIGHDWGAAIAYLAATQAPEKFDRLVTMAVPPVATFQRALRRHRAQLKRSWYMFFFQLRGIAEWRVRRNDFAFIDRLWGDWSPGWDYDAARMREVKRSLAAPGSLSAALGYYRQNLSLRPQQQAPIPVPALVLVGRNDGCVGAEIFEGLERDFSAPVELQVVEGTGHFLHLEDPEGVGGRIEAYLKADRASRREP